MATQTAAQQRYEEKIDYNAFLAACPSHMLLARISNKWVTLILAALGGDCFSEPPQTTYEPHPMRYSELARQLSGVSQKMLTQTLRSLERDGLITRTVTPTVPVTVTYELTPLGLDLHRAIRVLKVWAEENIGEVLENREKYDTAPSPR